LDTAPRTGNLGPNSRPTPKRNSWKSNESKRKEKHKKENTCCISLHQVVTWCQSPLLLLAFFRGACWTWVDVLGTIHHTAWAHTRLSLVFDSEVPSFSSLLQCKKTNNQPISKIHAAPFIIPFTCGCFTTRVVFHLQHSVIWVSDAATGLHLAAWPPTWDVSIERTVFSLNLNAYEVLRSGAAPGPNLKQTMKTHQNTS
jgi:hypothetical protein